MKSTGSKQNQKHLAISLFSSAGIGEMGLKSNHLEVIAANEVVPKRCAIYRDNFPETQMFEGDIWSLRDDFLSYCKDRLNGSELFLAYCTPPCQGMSSNGAGKLKSEIAAGRRPKEDQRNRLVIPALDILCELRPRWILFENVPGMRDTVISTDDGPANIIDYIRDRLGSEYLVKDEVLACADYGIPQLRRRLITIGTRDVQAKKYFASNGGTFFPNSEHLPRKTLWDAIGETPPLDAISGKEARTDFHPLHFVNVMNKEKYWWVSNTPEGDTAFNNQCVNPTCMFQGNPRHSDIQENGKWVASKETPIYCEKCGDLLPRPTLIDKDTGQRRLLRGFHSAYRRMKRDEPCRALTRNLIFEASDNKIHPTQNRTLSIYEASVIQTIADYDYKWTVSGEPATRPFAAQMIGESVPPRLIDLIVKKMIRTTAGFKAKGEQLLLIE